MERLKDAIKILLFITISFSLLFFTIKISSYIDSKSDKPKEKETVWLIPALKDKWNFLYLDDIDVKNDRYPVIYLRSGYKPILEKKDIVTVGWKYELINTADKRFNVTVIMKFVDRDGFVIATSTANDYARERHYLPIKSTLHISREEYDRINGVEWSISINDSYELPQQKDRYTELQALNDQIPYWCASYTTYLDEIGVLSYLGRWKKIASAIKNRPSPISDDLLHKLNIARTALPPWKRLIEKAEFNSLSNDEKRNIKDYLKREEEYGGYDPEKGYSVTLDMSFDVKW